ncbi:glycosyltransferase family 4 protein [Candidatus Shapirobacteria bacterium]|nr:glycosyltransferase family 4 protein [Candidatus Shapirobacteria bacterium]
MVSVVMVIERFWPLIGGSETQCSQLSEGLISGGARVLVVTKRWEEDFPKEEDLKQGFKVIRLGIPGRGRLIDYFAGVHLLAWLLRNHRLYNLIYVNGGLANTFGSTAILMGKLLSKWVVGKVATPGELFFSGPRALSPKRFVHPLIKLRLLIAKRADYYTAHTQEVEDELLGLGIEKPRIRKFTNSVDEKIFKPPISTKVKMDLRRKLDIPLNKTVVIYCGRLVKRKGLAFLLEAWKRIIQEKGDNVVLLILGSGRNQPDSVESELRGIVEKEGLKQVYFLGEKGKLTVAKFLRAADIFVYPSIHPEGTALSILEAMSSGLAVLGTRVGGIEALIENKKDGILVEKESPEALFLGLNYLLNNPDKRIKFGEKAREKILKSYSSSKITADFYHFFQSLVKRD